VPLFVTLATLTPAVLNSIRTTLDFCSNKTAVLNLGNDRHNITPIVIRMKAPNNLTTLNFVLDEVLKPGERRTLVRTIIFIKTRDLAQDAWEHLFKQLPDNVKSQVNFIHAGCHRCTKQYIMKHFQEGHIKILCATEVAGMVCV
jgi:superfamily II DNA helicase RecQ